MAVMLGIVSEYTVLGALEALKRENKKTEMFVKRIIMEGQRDGRTRRGLRVVPVKEKDGLSYIVDLAVFFYPMFSYMLRHIHS